MIQLNDWNSPCSRKAWYHDGQKNQGNICGIATYMPQSEKHRITDQGENPLLDYAYTYDPVGNILTKTTEHGN